MLQWEHSAILLTVIKHVIKIFVLSILSGPLIQVLGLAVDSLLIVTPIVGFCNCSMFCYALLYVDSSFTIILMEKRE